jgi:uncharacterized DUF497 family protein
MKLVWDAAKNQSNRRKHGISFEEASALFCRDDSERLDFYDSEHSEIEDRFTVIGAIDRGMIVVVYVEPSEDVVRMISARPATRHEIRLFVEYISGTKP